MLHCGLVCCSVVLETRLCLIVPLCAVCWCGYMASLSHPARCLLYVAACCSVWPCVAACCSALQYVGLDAGHVYLALHAVSYLLQCAAVCCSAGCSVVRKTRHRLISASCSFCVCTCVCVCTYASRTCRGALQRRLQHIASHCNTLQNTATHCDTLHTNINA